MTAHTTATMAEAQAAREKMRERENELARLSRLVRPHPRRFPCGASPKGDHGRAPPEEARCDPGRSG
jgi:hypothetical protein